MFIFYYFSLSLNSFSLFTLLHIFCAIIFKWLLLKIIYYFSEKEMKTFYDKKIIYPTYYNPYFHYPRQKNNITHICKEEYNSVHNNNYELGIYDYKQDINKLYDRFFKELERSEETKIYNPKVISYFVFLNNKVFCGNTYIIVYKIS
jgi:hypothetical protein